MKTLIIITIFLLSLSSLAANVNCPSSRDYMNKDGKFILTKEYKKLTSSEKQYCDKVYKKQREQLYKKQNLAKKTFGLSNLPLPLLVFLLVAAIGVISFIFNGINKAQRLVKNKTITKVKPKEESKPKEKTKTSETLITSKDEEKIYAQVAKELQENRNEGVWLKAYTENDGDEAKTKIAYTKKRVNEIMEELKKQSKE